MIKQALFLLFLHFSIVSNALCVGQVDHEARLSGPSGKVVFNLDSGKFTIYNKGILVISGATFSANEYSSDEPGNSFEHRQYAVFSNGMTGKCLEIGCRFKDGMEILWTATYYNDQPYLVLGMSFKNYTSSVFQLKKWAAMEHGSMFPALRKRNAKILDGNGGGENTSVVDAGYTRCRNNLLYTFDDSIGKRYSLVFGGVAYEDFEKHALVSTDCERENIIREREKKQQIHLINYLDLGEDLYGSAGSEPQLTVQRAWPVRFSFPAIKEIASAVCAYKKIIIKVRQLDTGKRYSFGFSWMDERGGRTESVYGDNGDGTPVVNLLSPKTLPMTSRGQLPEEFLCKLPVELTSKGNCRIIIECTKGPNAVLSEAWLSGGWPAPDSERFAVPTAQPLWFKAAVYAEDPVGKRIDPGKTYTPTKDLFYIDPITIDPFASLELYGRALKAFQHVDSLSLYTFPTVCLWYASHRDYGGGPSVNDSQGAIDEMKRAIKSGITNYTNAAIRLVPDNYELNNEQGWWDDTHWQKYGSGSDNPNSVVVEGSHYKKPFETTQKWASAIRRMGGIPLTYFQSARRSQDFCDRFPEYMLFNQSNHIIPDSNWLNLGKSSYDFTDTGFVRRMRSVYNNLRAGGVQGMMFDYTSTAWADFGGMDDHYSTAAAMYRNVFLLAHQALGRPQWIHERNLERGSDITLGLVSSQRVWGDTDGITDEMVSRTGLRWYKNRVVVSYDMDAKNTEKLRIKSRDHLWQMLTMAYVASGRLLLGNSFARMTAEDIFDLSRVFPFHETAKSARPIDAFIQKWPTVYQFSINKDWNQVTLYNTSEDSVKSFRLSLASPNYKGGLGLNPAKDYYFYDFWNNRYIAKLKGTDSLRQDLRKAEARMISVHLATLYPQFISTNRHIMQGYLELSHVAWNCRKSVYSGVAKVKANDKMIIVIAMNCYRPVYLMTSFGKCSWKWLNKADHIIAMELNSHRNKDIHWYLHVK